MKDLKRGKVTGSEKSSAFSIAREEALADIERQKGAAHQEHLVKTQEIRRGYAPHD